MCFLSLKCFQEISLKPHWNCIFSTKIERFMIFSVSKVQAAFSGRICSPLQCYNSI
ncbi:hypothetical protein HanPI659440_Chr05g0199291 [Helianthus annuus]|nr:hypothetical protein HanPI659440_Chr05g0199291 [Helianthus annuus]